ncbi:uncharacterized protein LOC135338393 isoform X2 [Halichondria panicea]|uniref:uncharacterized protein LOC135338393 isoform X2 n=1 Tax=Halichondria panicea TaxID=6063 RepID=UPI00312B7796
MASHSVDPRYYSSNSWTPGQPPNIAGSKAPPPLPPRPPDLPDLPPPPIPNTPRPNLNISQTLQYPGRHEVFTLPELVEKHQNLFPLKVVVAKGHYGDRGEDSVIATDEVYNIHFIKRSKVFTVKDKVGNKYILPLNSACKFGLYYQKGTRYFDTVEDVMKASPLPSVIAAQCSHSSGNEKTSVSRLEILVVKGVSKGRIGRKSILNVFSISKRQDKQLTKEIVGRFTTDPSYAPMYLSDLVKYVPFEFPLAIHFYPDYETEDQSSNYLKSCEKMTIIKEFIETSVVTSPLLEDDGDDDDDCMELNERVVDIPLSLPIEVSVLPPEEDDTDDYEQLYETTRTLISGYNPVLGKTLRDASDDYSYATQTQMFSAVRKGFENEGLKIEMPAVISSSSVPTPRFSMPQRRQDAESSPRGGSDQLDSSMPLGNKRRSMYQPLVKSPSHDDYQDMDLPQAHDSRQSSMSPSRSFDSSITPQPPSTYKAAPSVPPRRAATFREIHGGGLNSTPPPPVGPRKISLPTGSASSADGVFHAKHSLPPPPPPESALSRLQESMDSLVLKIKLLESTKPQDDSFELRQQIDSLSSVTQILQSTCSSLSNEISGLRKDMDTLKTQVNEISSNGGNSFSSSTTLPSLNCDQVITLLEAMGPSLARYKETFSQEDIDGDLLALCTEEVLENDLGIKHKLDRLKLMQVIRGTKSVESIMQGAYVQFEFNSGTKVPQ